LPWSMCAMMLKLRMRWDFMKEKAPRSGSV